jgi:hypothetical protein
MAPIIPLPAATPSSLQALGRAYVEEPVGRTLPLRDVPATRRAWRSHLPHRLSVASSTPQLPERLTAWSDGKELPRSSRGEVGPPSAEARFRLLAWERSDRHGREPHGDVFARHHSYEAIQQAGWSLTGDSRQREQRRGWSRSMSFSRR